MAVAAISKLDLRVAPQPPGEEPIDRAHLERMTLGEPSLEREVLALFDRQATLLLDRMREPTATARIAAHTIKGSAQGIGAWRVARAAQAVEHAQAPDFVAAVATLAATVDEAKLAISALLRAH